MASFCLAIASIHGTLSAKSGLKQKLLKQLALETDREENE